MTKGLLLLFLTVALFGCKKTCPNSEFYAGPDNYMQILQVSYTGHTFMGGKMLTFNSSVQGLDSIPDSMVYVEPLDFGSITFINSPSNEPFFSGGIVWSGLGQISYPKNFDPPSSFCSESKPVPCPSSSNFQLLASGSRSDTANYNSIWSAINKLGVTSYMVQKGCKIGLYAYTPSIGVGDPSQWSYIIFLYK